MSESHDGFPLVCVERSSHLEEYSRSRPASAGSRPRSLLNKMANAAAAVQQDDDPEPADAEPWVLEGWGDGPSVSEAAQQAALRLGPYIKNVPTTLVGLGASGTTRRVLSAGHQGRSPLKVSEARRKPGAPTAQAQTDRRASGPAAIPHAIQAATATVRRAAPPQNLEVGDESDVEPSAYMAPPAAASSHGPHTGQGSSGPSRLVGMQRGAPPAGRPAQQAAQSAPGAATRMGRREAPVVGGATGTSGAAGAGPGHSWGPAGADHSGSPRPPRSISAEACHPSSGAAAARTAQAAGRGAPAALPHAAAAAGGAAGAAHGHLPLPPAASPLQPLPGHLEPLSPLPMRNVGGRAGQQPSDSSAAGGLTDSQPPPRSSSFSSIAHPLGLGDHLDSHSGPGPLSASPAPPPALPGLITTGRRLSSFRAEGALSGWDPEAPAVQGQQLQSPGQGPSNLGLWIGPSAPGAGTSGLQVGAPSASGRGSPLQGTQPPQHRREQVSGNSRLQRGTAGAPAGLLDLSLGPDRPGPDKPSQHGGLGAAAAPGRAASRAQAGVGLHGGQSTSRSGSPDVKGVGFPPPQQDALTEFCASRAEMGSAGSGLGTPSAEIRGHGLSSSGMLVPLPVPMRATSLAKMPAAVARV